MAIVGNIRYHIVRTCKAIWYIYICFVDPSIFTFGMVLWLEVVSVVFESTKRHDDPTASSSMDFVWAASRPGRLNQHSDNIRVANVGNTRPSAKEFGEESRSANEFHHEVYSRSILGVVYFWLKIMEHLQPSTFHLGIELVILYRPLRTPITGW